MKYLKEIVAVLEQIIPLVKTAQDGGPGSGQKGHTGSRATRNARRNAESLLPENWHGKNEDNPIDKGAWSPQSRHVESVASGLESHRQSAESSSKKFPVGSKVRPNSTGSKSSEVIGHSGNMIHTTGGNSYHHTKVVKG